MRSDSRYIKYGDVMCTDTVYQRTRIINVFNFEEINLFTLATFLSSILRFIGPQFYLSIHIIHVLLNPQPTP